MMDLENNNPADAFFQKGQTPKASPNFFVMRENINEDNVTKPAGPTQSLDELNEFNAPIPGQSLTDSPGNAAWEHAPQFVEVSKALDYVYGQLLKRTNTKKLLTLLKNGVPAEAVARTVLFSGFAQGKWTPDLVLLMARPTLAMVVAMGKAAEIKNMKIGLKKRGEDAAIMGAKMALGSMPHSSMSAPPEKPEVLSIMERPLNG